MENDIKKLLNDLKAGRTPETVLPQVMNECASAYGILSLYDLLMEYATYKEMKNEKYVDTDKFNSEIFSVVEDSIKRGILGEYLPENEKNVVENLVLARDKNIDRMDRITFYADKLSLFEYVINRQEMSFEEKEVSVTDDDELSKEVLKKIFESDDNTLINFGIRNMLYNLPVRMTKDKFTDIIKDAFNVYKTSDKEQIDSFEYILRSVAGIRSVSKKNTEFDELEKSVEFLKAYAKQTGASKDEYILAKQKMNDAIDIVRKMSDDAMAIQEVLNSVLSYILMKPYFMLSAGKQAARLEKMLDELMSSDDNTDSVFSEIEGEVEIVSERINAVESLFTTATEKYAKNIEELMLSTVCSRIEMTQKLCSNSSFVKLSEKFDNVKEDGYCDKIRDGFIKDIRELFEKNGKLLNRAVMASVLRELPVFFGNRTEVMDYVRNSYASCSDKKEKYLCTELFMNSFD